MIALPSSDCGTCASCAMAHADQEEASASESRRADNPVINAPCFSIVCDKGINELLGMNLYCIAQNLKKNAIFSALFLRKIAPACSAMLALGK
ncbi:hypothetical protein [Sphingobium sp. EM0848]|uniref:hypothetical protein n=1 Tax=Sphingobium sp. EM0848 TaxID=2743473 RepID=UPI00159C8234|nr:hypothetical protein [Sphingobium sp. EM0848]